MKKCISKKISENIHNKNYEKAYIEGKTALISNSENKEVLNALYELTACLRSEAMSFASKKANYSNISSYEVLLEKVNVLTSQDMYGNFK